MKWPRTRSRILRSGFTLLECLVASLVVSVGVMGVAMCLSTSSVMNWRAQRLSIAAQEDMRVMEGIREYNGPGPNFISWIQTADTAHRSNVVKTVNGSTTTITSILTNSMLNNNTQTLTITPFSDTNNPTMSNYLTKATVTTTWTADTGTVRSTTMAAIFMTRQQ